jgi:hypothetical protein
MWAPPRPASTTALHTLRAELDSARTRGEPFAACWPRAVAVALAEVSERERQEWRWALERTRETWERCFLRLPAEPGELALQLIADDRGERLPDLACEFCGCELESVKRPGAALLLRASPPGRVRGACGRPLPRGLSREQRPTDEVVVPDLPNLVAVYADAHDPYRLGPHFSPFSRFRDRFS